MNSIQPSRTTPGIERVGDTIHRPTGDHSAFVHALLRHLEARHFVGAPRWLGIDSSGREILSYLVGDVPQELGTFSAEQVMNAARLLRTLHDATMDFEGRGTREVVCHGDASPCNTVFQNDCPHGFIDFDAAHAGDRREDVGYSAWLWLDLGNEDWDPVEQGRRIGQFVIAYGALELDDALQAVIDAQLELSNRRGTPVSVQEWAKHCLQWSDAHRIALEVGLTSARCSAF